MIKIINKFSLGGDKFMPEMNLRQPGFTYSASGSFIKYKERIQKFKQTKDSRYIYQNKPHKACFQHYVAYGDFKDLPRRTATDKALRDKAFHVAKIPKYDQYQRGLASMVYKCFDKNTSGGAVKSEFMSNQELVKEMYKQLLEHLNTFTHLLMIIFNKGFPFLSPVIDIYNKYAWIVPLTDQKGVTISNTLQNILNDLNRKAK